MATKDLGVATGRSTSTRGRPGLKSIGPIAFGPDGILFVADNAAAAVYAIELAGTGEAVTQPPEVDGLDRRLAGFLGCDLADIVIRDLAVDPVRQAVYLAVTRGHGDQALPVLIRLGPTSDLIEVSLDDVAFSSTSIDDAPAENDARLDTRVVPAGETGEGIEDREYAGIHLRLARQKLRSVTMTDLAYVSGLLLVAGASNEEFSSTLRRIPFPFRDGAISNSLEIFHVSHGKYETASPIRAFVPYGEMSVLASYTCTPVVHFSLADLESGTMAKGRTVAELGSMNTPLDLLAYKRSGREYLLVSNSRHPLIKIDCADIDRQEALVRAGEPTGTPRQVLAQAGVTRMANWNGSHVLMLQRDAAGNLDLRAYDTASI